MIGKFFAVGGGDSLVSFWDRDDQVCLRTFGNLNGNVKTIGFSHDNQLIAAAGPEDNFIDISHRIFLILFSSLIEILVTLENNSSIYQNLMQSLGAYLIFIVESGDNVHTIQNGSPVNCLAWHPKKHLLAYTGKEKDKHDRDTGYIKVFGSFH